MKRSTKRVVGWGTGVSVGIVLVLLTSVLVITLNSTPKEKIDTDQMVSADTVIDNVGH